MTTQTQTRTHETWQIIIGNINSFLTDSKGIHINTSWIYLKNWL
jgi:hypothetical protein